MSNELGRGSAKKAKFSVKVIVSISFSIGFVLFLLFLFLRERLAYIFTNDEEVAAMVSKLSPLLAFSILLNGVQPVLSGTIAISLILSLIFEGYQFPFPKHERNHLTFPFPITNFISTGVALGAGWQSTVAYVNIASYYLIGIPVGVVLGYPLKLQVQVSYFNLLLTHSSCLIFFFK